MGSPVRQRTGISAIRDQRRWRERGPKVLGGLERYFPELASPDLSAAVVKANRQRIAELEADVADLKISKDEFATRMRAISTALCAVGDALGQPQPPAE